MSFFRAVWSLVCPNFLKRRSRTVRYAFPLVFVSLALLGAAVITSTNVSYVRLESSTPAVREGEWFEVDVYANAKMPVNAVDVTLSFPEDQIEVLGIDVGESVITLWTQDPYVEGGQVHLSGGTYRRGFIGEHLIATINMRAKQTGIAELSTETVRLLAGDGTGASVPSHTVDAGTASLVVVDQSEDPSSINVSAEISIVTDIDGDGKVTLRDISVFMSAWFDRSTVYDFNSDGRMTFRDFSIILADSFLK